MQKKADCAKEYILNVIKAMGIEDTEIEVTRLENGALFEIKSEEFEKLIGKRAISSIHFSILHHLYATG